MVLPAPGVLFVILYRSFHIENQLQVFDFNSCSGYVSFCPVFERFLDSDSWYKLLV